MGEVMAVEGRVDNLVVVLNLVLLLSLVVVGDGGSMVDWDKWGVHANDISMMGWGGNDCWMDNCWMDNSCVVNWGGNSVMNWDNSVNWSDVNRSNSVNLSDV